MDNLTKIAEAGFMQPRTPGLDRSMSKVFPERPEIKVKAVPAKTPKGAAKNAFAKVAVKVAKAKLAKVK